MLDAISDFWKPSKKPQPQEKLRTDQLQVGSSVVFGFVPQASLSGRKLQVTGINTYQFGSETLTSFMLSQDKDPGISMIVAESDGEQYLAISRRIAISDRMKLFESQDLENVTEKPDAATLPCKDALSDYKGWVVPSYKRELQGLGGRLYRGDFRKTPLPAAGGDSQEFKYTLLVSDNNEHAIEIEKYHDGRVEVYATVYRRRSDIGEVAHPTRNDLARPDLKFASKPEEKPAAVAASAAPSPVKAVTPSLPPVPVAPAPVKSEPIKLQELAKPAAPAEAPKPVPVMKTEPKIEPKIEPKVETNVKPPQEEKPRMEMNEMNGANGAKAPASADVKPKFGASPAASESYLKQEVKTVSKMTSGNGMDNEAIECDLRVANKIIDEAIRNEMRLSDVVRRIIELPVANQEAVQIPVTLSDDDYSLLGIRYGITSADRNSIKRRIIEDLNDFSGNNSQKKAA